MLKPRQPTPQTTLPPSFTATTASQWSERKRLERRSNMATSRGPLRLGWTLRVLSNTHSALRKISTSAFNRNTFRVILSTQRRFYSAEAQPEEVDTKGDSPRNLLEVYEVEPTLLQGPRKKPISQDYVEQEIEKSRKIRSRVPVCINPVDAQWTPESKRVGLVGVKLGMSCLWLKDGTRKPVTLVEVITA